MKFYGFDRDKAIARCQSPALGRAGRDADGLRPWNRPRPEHIVELLDRASPDIRNDARNLAALLSRAPWRLPVQGDAQGKANQLVSNVREIAVAVAGRNYKLHCTEAPGLKLERISVSSA